LVSSKDKDRDFLNTVTLYELAKCPEEIMDKMMRKIKEKVA
jgi:hypothetical protein